MSTQQDQVESKGDKAQVGLSIDGNDHIEHLTKVHKWFETGIDAYRVAVAVAIARGMQESDLKMPKQRTTKYGVGSIDESGKLREMIVTLRPELSDRPYAHSEWLAEIGLSIIRNELEEGKYLSEIISEGAKS